MSNKAELMYEFKNAKSLQIHPKDSRQPVSRMALSSPSRIERRALNASEKEVKHLMDVANRRLKRIIKMSNEKDSHLEKLIMENVAAGVHLSDEIFIPEYLGFMEIAPEEVDEIRIYCKDGHSMTRVDEGWLIVFPDGGRRVLQLGNMQIAITVLESLGFDVNFKDYLAGVYDPERKTLEQSARDIINGIAKKREEESKLLKKGE